MREEKSEGIGKECVGTGSSADLQNPSWVMREVRASCVVMDDEKVVDGGQNLF